MKPEHGATLPVLGIPVRLHSDAAEVVEAFQEAFAAWRVLDAYPELVGDTPVEVRVFVVEGSEGHEPHAPVRYRSVPRDRLVVTTPGSVCTADARRREVVGWVTRELLGDREHFRYNVLEATVLFVLSELDRVPLHASAVVRGGSALLLTGPSGTGKSTLTYAAARAGIEVLTDEIVYAQRSPFRVWGMPTFLHLPRDARRWFPELAEAPTRLLANGKEKIAMGLTALGATAPSPVAVRTGVCVLERAPGRGLRCVRLTAAELEEAMLTQVEAGFDVYADELGDLARRLSADGGWHLTLDGGPEAAVEVVDDLLDEVGRVP